MRTLIANAAPVPYSLKREFIEKLGEGFLYEVYGSTELGVVTVLPPEDQLRKPGSCGKTYGPIDVRIVRDDGTDAPIGERGRLLSGGERQRLAIARALLKDPPILILDEATSALDPVTEARVTAALDEVMKGRTTFVIAHRLATIRNATRILVFDNGRIIEAGTYDELLQRGGFFAEVVKAQFGLEPQTAKLAIAISDEDRIVET